MPPDLVAEHLRALLLPSVGAVAGRINERNQTAKQSQRTGFFHYWTATPERGFDQPGEFDVDHVPGGNFCTWRQIVEVVGGFDERLNVGAALYEETEFSLRVKHAGYRVYYNGAAYLDHLAAPSGGCRVDDVEHYIWALAHNRTIIIRRYLNWLQQVTAFAELLRLGLAYSVKYRQVRALRALIEGCVAASSAV